MFILLLMKETAQQNIFCCFLIRLNKRMCVSGYIEFQNRDDRFENIFILLKVFIWGQRKTIWLIREIQKKKTLGSVVKD